MYQGPDDEEKDRESYDDYLTRCAEEGAESHANGEDDDQWAKDHDYSDEDE